jgi:hypothetical protein
VALPGFESWRLQQTRDDASEKLCDAYWDGNQAEARNSHCAYQR